MRHSALITGGTGSIGEAIVRRFADADCSVAFQYFSNEQRAAELESKCGAHGIRLDLAASFNLEPANYDIVVNCAGINITAAPLGAIPDEELLTTLAINLIAPFRIIRSCLPFMSDRRWGRIINIGSIYSIRGSTNNTSYNISKHGLSGLTKSIAVDYAKYGITANDICPSAVESNLMRTIADRQAAKSGSTADAFLAEVRAANPTGRMATPADIAAAALFLASDDAAFINGTAMVVDGGQIA